MHPIVELREKLRLIFREMGMLLSDDEKEGKLGVLGEISSMLSNKDAELIGAKRKKPAVIAAEEAKLFPEEEAEEDRKMGDSMELAGQGSEPSAEEKAMIKELYHRYFG